MTKTLGKLLGALSDKVVKEVDFEAQPEPFDWIEIGALAWQVINLEVVQIQSLSSVPTGVVNAAAKLLSHYAALQSHEQ